MILSLRSSFYDLSIISLNGSRNEIIHATAIPILDEFSNSLKSQVSYARARSISWQYIAVIRCRSSLNIKSLKRYTNHNQTLALFSRRFINLLSYESLNPLILLRFTERRDQTYINYISWNIGRTSHEMTLIYVHASRRSSPSRV